MTEEEAKQANLHSTMLSIKLVNVEIVNNKIVVFTFHYVIY